MKSQGRKKSQTKISSYSTLSGKSNAIFQELFQELRRRSIFSNHSEYFLPAVAATESCIHYYPIRGKGGYGREREREDLWALSPVWNVWIHSYPPKLPKFLLSCLYTSSLGVHTEHSRKDLCIFCKRMKFDHFVLWVLATRVATWTEPPLLTLLWMNKSVQVSKAGGPSGTEGRSSYFTFHPLFQHLCFPCNFTCSQGKAALTSCSFLFPLKCRDSRNCSSSLANM